MIKKILLYLLSAVIIACGVISTIELVSIFNIKSREVGTAITIETVNNYSEVAKFDLGLLVFESPDYVNFSYSAKGEPVEFNGKDKDYIILINSEPVTNLVLTNGKISGDFIKTFYDTDGKVTTTATLHVVIEFFTGQTKLTTSITNSNNSVGFLNQYINIHGFILKVVEVL